MRRALVLALGAVLAALVVAPVGQAASSLGQERIGKAAVRTPSGAARAVSSRARATATVTRLRVYVATRSRARTLTAGLYADRNGRPGTLLASASRKGSAAGWRELAIPAVKLTQGDRYWLAVLGTGGDVRTRVARAACRSEVGASRNLRALPKRWRAGARSSRCLVTAAALTATDVAGADTAPAGTTTVPGSVPGGLTTVPPGGAGGSTPPPPTASLPPAATLGTPAPAAVASARSAPLLRFGRSYPGGADVNDGWGGGASMVLATASYAGDASADARLLAQIRDTIAGGNEPVANGGYPAQHERWVTGMFVLARRTARVWNQLSNGDRIKIDLVMKGALVASAFASADANPDVQANRSTVTLDGEENNRDWNPNYREGMVGMMVVGAAYFGGGAAAQTVLDTYDPAAFLAQLQSAGLTNQVATFSWKANNPSSSAPSAAAVQSTIRNYRYHGYRLDQPMAIARDLTQNTYNADVACGVNGGAGISTSAGPAGVLVSGCAGLPNKGQLGELQELDGIDGSGPRSSALYGYDGFRGNNNNNIVLLASGLWQNGADADAIRARLRIGVPDLWYKLAQGYRNYAKGTLQWIPDAPSEGVLRDDNANFSFPYSRTLWDQVTRPALGL